MNERWVIIIVIAANKIILSYLPIRVSMTQANASRCMRDSGSIKNSWSGKKKWKKILKKVLSAFMWHVAVLIPLVSIYSFFSCSLFIKHIFLLSFVWFSCSSKIWFIFQLTVARKYIDINKHRIYQIRRSIDATHKCWLFEYIFSSLQSSTFSIEIHFTSIHLSAVGDTGKQTRSFSTESESTKRKKRERDNSDLSQSVKFSCDGFRDYQLFAI